MGINELRGQLIKIRKKSEEKIKDFKDDQNPSSKEIYFENKVIRDLCDALIRACYGDDVLLSLYK